MENKEQIQAYKESVKSTASDSGADAAFEMLVSDGWTVPDGQEGNSPPGFRVFATASWKRRVLMRDSDESFWALELTE